MPETFLRDFLRNIGLSYENYRKYFYEYDKTLEDIIRRRGKLQTQFATEGVEQNVYDLLRKSENILAQSGFARSGALERAVGGGLGALRNKYYSTLTDALSRQSMDIYQERQRYIRQLYDIARSLIQSGAKLDTSAGTSSLSPVSEFLEGSYFLYDEPLWGI